MSGGFFLRRLAVFAGFFFGIQVLFAWIAGDDFTNAVLVRLAVMSIAATALYAVFTWVIDRVRGKGGE